VKAKAKPQTCWGFLVLAWRGMRRGGIITRNDYRTGEKAPGISSLFCCRIGRTPAWGGH
jgi:hypothetical protein